MATSSSKLPIFFLVLTVAILVAGGYYVYTTMNPDLNFSNPADLAKRMAGGTQLSTLKVTEADFASISDSLIRKHLVAQVNVGTYRITTNQGEFAGGGEQVVEIAMTGNDVAYRMVQRVSGIEKSDMITIGDTTYLKDYKDGMWWKQKAQPVDEAATSGVSEIDNKFDPEIMKQEYTVPNNTYKNLGVEPCGTSTCHKYEELQPEGSEGSRTIWFDTKTLLLFKETSRFGRFDSTQIYSYDNIVIAVPSPTKDVPEGKSIYDYMMTSMINDEEVTKMMKEYRAQE